MLFWLFCWILQDLVPCIPILFKDEQIVLWRGKVGQEHSVSAQCSSRPQWCMHLPYIQRNYLPCHIDDFPCNHWKSYANIINCSEWSGWSSTFCCCWFVATCEWWHAAKQDATLECNSHCFGKQQLSCLQISAATIEWWFLLWSVSSVFHSLTSTALFVWHLLSLMLCLSGWREKLGLCPFEQMVCNLTIWASISCSSDRLRYIESIRVGDKVYLTYFSILSG
jgi:hypothetical protein